MKGNDFDKIVGEKLNDYREQPSPALFSRIEKSLGREIPQAVVRKKSRSALFYIPRIGAAAAVLVGLVLGYTLFHDDGGKPTDNNVAAVEITEAIQDDVKVAEIPDTSANAKPVKSTKHGSRVKENMPIAEELRKVIEEDMRAAQEKAVNGSGTLISDGKIFVKNTPDVEMAGINNFIGGPELIIPDSGMYEDKGNIPDINLRQPIDIYWEELLEKEGPQKRSKGKISGSLYAGNFGAGTGNYYSSDPKDLITNKMNVTETSGMDYEGGGSMLQAPGVKAPSPSSAPDPKHRMPVNYGLSIGIPLTDRLALTTGLNYSYLSSYSSQTTGKADKTNTLSREIHYAGIPLGVTYSFYNTRSFSFYVSAGAMLEKAVYARELTTYAFDSGNTEKSQKINIKGVSPSVRGAVGVSLRLGKGITLYVEPGVAYYFEQVNSIPSYRTEYPVNFSLTAGIRFGI